MNDDHPTEGGPVPAGEREGAIDPRARFEPERRCERCGAKLTVQIFPHGYEAHCTPCERRARFAAAADD